jgi:D-alanine-D-alanine ligase
VLNLCDGDEVNGSPGLSVIRCLKEHGIRFTGADERFYDVTTSKIVMKEAFDRAGVPTSPWEVVPRTVRATPRSSGGSARRSSSSRPSRPAAWASPPSRSSARIRRSAHSSKRLHNGYHGWDVAGGGVFVEKFVEGPEYTTFIVGSYDRPARARRPIRPSSASSTTTLPPNERFLSFDRLWGMYEVEDPIETMIVSSGTTVP